MFNQKNAQIFFNIFQCICKALAYLHLNLQENLANNNAFFVNMTLRI